MVATSPDRQCTATTKAGHRCPTGAGASGLCHVHDPALLCGRPKKRGGRCGVATGGGPCATHADTPAPEAGAVTEPPAPDTSAAASAATVPEGYASPVPAGFAARTLNLG
ncbi:hypothetical protein [Streptomyces sp. NPDC047928]|uniref:hypothetical protein n=1 Tax=unclassified Streptomyces TaxID=2593676 RepID=UPI00371FA0CC